MQIEDVYALLLYLRELWNGYAYPGTTTAAFMQYALVIALGVFVIGLWLAWVKSREPRLWVSALATMLVPAALWANSHLSSSFQGTPDTRCAQYANGTLRFVLVGLPIVVPVSTDNVFGAQAFALTVRAPQKWGDEVHLCVLSLDDPRVKKLYKAFSELSTRPGFGEAAMRGMIGFTFGSGIESPNVTWEPDLPPEEKGEPEKPPRREDA
ncbi:hypothetical protein COU20_03870 [Candidatus Kaiserbacteria bacterium CG10_big_fil_rev_8_21_14_0_10_59_10]|uniref:Uncharacterized protein n=1 Tax=Candidatus Kaiserbacteria bacterium CG10_big_fil_rev_8_21_14_0_10_59_10 TaxID=1974612 RepID=A0A2H0U783_9BACT|nr:MAG: hypothetical protein COU20_03870 [Candidatus Kaiserbacteria bacterium CG10_big_fil_rev_8_21_14_0_10_59_10]